VAVLKWPEEEPERRRLASAGAPRLLLVAPCAPPPSSVDALEDWLRLPAEPEELVARRASLQRRARGRAALDAVPVLDDDGRLHAADGSAWVALPPVEARVAAALLEQLGSVVYRRDLLAAGWPEGVTDERVLDGCVKRLRRRLTEVGLRIHTIAGRGALLEQSA
jgi:DNA-binding response OmpR family regulator